MRIGLINAGYPRRYYGVQKRNDVQNINFGKFEDDRAKNALHKVLVENQKRPADKKHGEELFNYFGKTPFVMIKYRAGFTYAVMLKDEVNKHKSKEYFNRLAENYTWHGVDDSFANSGILENEPDYLTLLGGGEETAWDYLDNADYLRKDLQEAEKARVFDENSADDCCEANISNLEMVDGLYGFH